jgi:hypothetical protein
MMGGAPSTTGPVGYTGRAGSGAISVGADVGAPRRGGGSRSWLVGGGGAGGVTVRMYESRLRGGISGNSTSAARGMITNAAAASACAAIEIGSTDARRRARPDASPE